jgi:hypothetical protein
MTASLLNLQSNNSQFLAGDATLLEQGKTIGLQQVTMADIVSIG